MIPVRCFTCNAVIADKYEFGIDVKPTRYCCRKNIQSHVPKICDKMLENTLIIDGNYRGPLHWSISSDRSDSVVDYTDESTAQFKLPIDYSDIHVVNSLRRVLNGYTPVIAIDSVLIYENTTEHSDEFIAHRLGLIPVKGTIDPTDTTNNYSFVFDNKCADYIETWYSDQLILESNNESPTNIELQPNIPLVKVCKNQKLIFKAFLKIGYGKDHAKFSPVSHITFKNDPDNKVVDFKIETLYGKTPKKLMIEAIDTLKTMVSLGAVNHASSV